MNSDLERIISVSRERQPMYGIRGKRVVFYTVHTESKSGGKFYRLPSYRFDGLPSVGAMLGYIDVDQAPKHNPRAYLRIYKYRTR
ncbi:MAG: hypothetical protein ACLRFK_00670 [Alphaproteobacteria bacterium]